MRVQKDSFLLNVPVAHRGLHDISKGIPENSYKAFDEAMTAGYAIETDIRFTADGKIVLFHDDELSRLTDGNGKVYDKTYRELSALGLKGTTERIPLFSEFLEHVGGKVPLLIEIKDQPERSELVKEAAALLKSYRGEYALQAFNPFYLLQMKKYAPDALRGQLFLWKIFSEKLYHQEHESEFHDKPRLYQLFHKRPSLPEGQKKGHRTPRLDGALGRCLCARQRPGRQRHL